ncbi:MAG: serine hydrolase [Ferruginibacter sp.]|nr:serine hydrolase [Chitinophagaceae bacterium]
MKSNLLIILLLITVGACKEGKKHNPPPGLKSIIPDSILTKIDNYLDANVDSGFSGVALLADKGHIVFHKAYNGRGDHIDTSTAFYIASNTKSFVAAAILQLLEKKELSLFDSITRYFKNVPVDKKNITIQNLLTHTSGLDDCECTDGETDKEKVIRSILATGLKNTVGQKWAYANENYYLLQFIAEQVIGRSLNDHIKENIFKPAGMIHSGFWGYENEIPVTIAPLNDSLKARPLYQKIFANGLPKPKLGTAIFSTTRDLLNWMIALKQEKIISAAGLASSFQPYEKALIRDVNDTALYYGYGWIPTVVKGKSVINVFHAGREDWMMNNRIYMLENGLIIIVWSMDKRGPESDAMATVLTKELVAMLENE